MAKGYSIREIILDDVEFNVFMVDGEDYVDQDGNELELVHTEDVDADHDFEGDYDYAGELINDYTKYGYFKISNKQYYWCKDDRLHAVDYAKYNKHSGSVNLYSPEGTIVDTLVGENITDLSKLYNLYEEIVLS